MTYEETIQQLEQFRTFLTDLCSETTTEDELESLYDENIVITLKDHRVTIPFEALSYNNLVDFINNIMEDYAV